MFQYISEFFKHIVEFFKLRKQERIYLKDSLGDIENDFLSLYQQASDKNQKNNKYNNEDENINSIRKKNNKLKRDLKLMRFISKNKKDKIFILMKDIEKNSFNLNLFIKGYKDSFSTSFKEDLENRILQII